MAQVAAGEGSPAATSAEPWGLGRRSASELQAALLRLGRREDRDGGTSIRWVDGKGGTIHGGCGARRMGCREKATLGGVSRREAEGRRGKRPLLTELACSGPRWTKSRFMLYL